VRCICLSRECIVAELNLRKSLSNCPIGVNRDAPLHAHPFQGLIGVVVSDEQGAF
jgi:hypothetical protein